MTRQKSEQKQDSSTETIIHNYFDTSVNGQEMTEFRQEVQDCIDSFLTRKKITSPQTLDELMVFFKNSEIPDEPMRGKDYINYLKKNVLPHAVNVGDPRYVGHMTSRLPGFFQYISQMMSALNQNNVKKETSKVYTLLERQVLGMMHRLVFDFPDVFYDEHIQERRGNLGIVVSCGTLANITSMWIARNKALQPNGSNIS